MKVQMKKKKYLTGIVAVMAAVTVVWAVAVSLRSGASYVATVHKPGAAIRVGGREMWTSISGTYAARNIQGMAVVDTYLDVEASLGLRRGQIPYMTVSDIDERACPKETQHIRAVVEAMGGGTVEALLDISLDARKKGKFIRTPKGFARVAVGLPVQNGLSQRVYVICVRPDGEVIVMQDTDANPDTVTFNVQAGKAVYAIVTGHKPPLRLLHNNGLYGTML